MIRNGDKMPLRLHLGCGKRFIPGLVHIDAIPGPHIDYVTSIARMPFIETGSVEYIYACHVLEHFGRHEYMQVLLEWARLLCPGGLLRLAVPDFSAVAEHYTEGRMRDGLGELIGMVCGGQRDEHDFHKMIFDYERLTRSLEQAGLRNVRRWDWRLTEHSHIDDYSQSYLPHMDKESGWLMSLNVEADR